MPHKQEGKYFAFNFSADYTDGTEALALFQVSNGKLEEVYNPSDYNNLLIGEIGEEQDELAFDLLTRGGVREVYGFRVMGSPRRFLDTDLIYDYPGGWISYEGVYDGKRGEYVSRFRARGINLSLFTDV